jgi:hypothetical protein
MIIEQEICNKCGGEVLHQTCHRNTYVSNALNDLIKDNQEYSYVLCERCVFFLFESMVHKPKVYDLIADKQVKCKLKANKKSQEGGC